MKGQKTGSWKSSKQISDTYKMMMMLMMVMVVMMLIKMANQELLIDPIPMLAMPKRCL
jgi:hypothetical protein